jgi:WD40 repeat protein
VLLISDNSLTPLDSLGKTLQTEVAEIIVTGSCVVGHGKAHSRKRKHFYTDDGDEGLDFSAAKVKWFQGRARGGVMQVEFSSDGQGLYSLSRRANAVLKWDLRTLSSSSFCPGVASYQTQNDTNQRIEFAQHDDTQIWVGGQDKCIRVYDCHKPDNPMATIDKFPGVVNGVSVTKLGSQILVSASSGSRMFPSDDDWEHDDPHLNSGKNDIGMLQLLDVKLRPVV